MRLCPGRRLLFVAFFVLAAAFLRAEGPVDRLPVGISAAQIVDQLQLHNRSRTEDLKRYRSLRQYRVEYRGFATSRSATMSVEIDYNASTGKSFRILSQSGSQLLCDKVLKRAVESEKEAAQDKGATALTPSNYRFQLVGSESVAGRPAYVLSVEPATENRFLYRGRIWVDAADFAVTKIEAQPAKNPSFWIARTLIHQTFVKAGEFWLPASNRSETKVRIGGTAVFTIDYGRYEIAPAAM
jgi:hypothetical protein